MSHLNHKIDRPIGSPEEDLFGWDRYIRILSSSLEKVIPPFTVGIYGQWGEGKTSFVNLLLRQIKESTQKGQEQPLTIEFSAWPFNDSETLWKALIFKIAEKLMEGQVTEANKEKIPKKSWMTKEVFSWNKAEESKQDKSVEIYQKLMDKINTINFTGVTKSREIQSKFHDNELIANLVLTGVDMMTKVSPMISGIKDLVGLENSKIKNIFKGNNKGSRESQIKFVDEFSQLLGELFQCQAKGRKVYVFVDDLDRCFPDVALDILEAIKIFLKTINCIFIVAVDLGLVGEGLKMRFRDLLVQEGNDSMSGFLQKKGKQYIEKIIQFQVNLPPRSGVIVKRYISAQFPRWTIASDIINSGVGGNPRRLIHHCNSLSYYYSVYENIHREKSNSDSGMSTDQLAIVDKVLAIGSLDNHLVKALDNILTNEKFTQQSKSNLLIYLDRWSNSVESSMDNICDNFSEFNDIIEYLKKVKNYQALKEIMKWNPPFEGCDQNVVSIIASFSDIHVDEEGSNVFRTQDKVFGRILKRVRQVEISAETLFEEDVKKFIGMLTLEEGIEILRDFRDIANKGKWAETTRVIEESLTNIYYPSNLEFDNFPLAKNIYDKVRSDKRRDYILEDPQFSLIPVQSFLLIFDLIDSLPNKPEVIVPAMRNELASKILASDQITNEELVKIKNAVLQRYDRMIFLAYYLFSLRTFAKLEILTSIWPNHANGLREEGLSYLINLENPFKESEENSNRFTQKKFSDHENLKKLLQAPPLFQEIKEKEIFKFFAASNTLIMESTSESKLNLSNTISDDFNYENYQILISDIGEDEFEVTTSYVSNGKEEKKPRRIVLSDKEIDALGNAPHYLFNHSLASVAEFRHAALSLSRPKQPYQSVEELGARLFTLIFNSREQANKSHDIIHQKINFGDDFFNFLKELNDRKSRIVFDIRSGKLQKIPWETIFFRQRRSFPALLSRQFSVIRVVNLKEKNINTISRRTFFLPLRILIATPNPKDLGYLNSHQERQEIRESLKKSVELKRVEILELKETTLQDLQDAIRNFDPHIFHFGGHATYLAEKSQGALVFQKKDDLNKDIIPISQIIEILAKDTNIALAILNGCDTGVSSNEDIYSSVAGELVQGGVPAVIASNRNIMDHVSIAFAREFYRVFGEGYPIEIALIEARKHLKYWNWDWSAYSIYANKNFVNEMPEFRIPQVDRRGSQMANE